VQVASVVGRAELLAGVFYLLAIISYHQAARTDGEIIQGRSMFMMYLVQISYVDN